MSSHSTDFIVDWDDWDDEPVAPTTRVVAPAPVSAPAPAIPSRPIASLGTRQQARRKPAAPKPKPQQDDIFASMGLAAKPTFSHPASAGRTTQAATTPSALAAAAEEMDVDPGAEWDDDGDLDDLLDD